VNLKVQEAESAGSCPVASNHMSDINITYSVDCHQDRSKETVQSMLLALEDKYAIKHEFINEQECALTGSGVTGQLTLEDKVINIHAKLGFFMLPFKSVIETEIINKLNEYFNNH